MTETEIRSELEEVLTLGQKLKLAREALNLSIFEVAHKTTLKQSHIESLEDDVFILDDIPILFVKGYVRTYLRFLNLPESWANEADYGEGVSAKKPRSKRALKTDNPHRQAKWIKLLTWGVLLCTISMSCMWWWQEYQKEQVGKEYVLNPQSSSEVSAQENTTTEPNSEKTDVPVKVAPQKSKEQAVENPKPASGSTTLSQAPAQTENTAQQTAESKDIQTAKDGQDTAKIKSTPTEITDELYILVHADESWISVRDTKEKRLAEKLYSAGEEIKLSNNGEYLLTIGAPANVKIYYRGQEVPLRIDGRVARIRLPLTN